MYGVPLARTLSAPFLPPHHPLPRGPSPFLPRGMGVALVVALVNGHRHGWHWLHGWLCLLNCLGVGRRKGGGTSRRAHSHSRTCPQNAESLENASLLQDPVQRTRSNGWRSDHGWARGVLWLLGNATLVTTLSVLCVLSCIYELARMAWPLERRAKLCRPARRSFSC